ncbi:MAG: hypothetical protein ACO34E_16190 [Limisphaerales bacterium]|jgi:hypothetical protein
MKQKIHVRFRTESTSASGNAGRAFVERLVLIHLELAGRGCPSLRRLSEVTEVCPRTLHRDLDFMRTRLMLPVTYDKEAQGYRYELEQCLPGERRMAKALFGAVTSGAGALDE